MMNVWHWNCKANTSNFLLVGCLGQKARTETRTNYLKNPKTNGQSGTKNPSQDQTILASKVGILTRSGRIIVPGSGGWWTNGLDGSDGSVYKINFWLKWLNVLHQASNHWSLDIPRRLFPSCWADWIPESFYFRSWIKSNFIFLDMVMRECKDGTIIQNGAKNGRKNF